MTIRKNLLAKFLVVATAAGSATSTNLWGDRIYEQIFGEDNTPSSNELGIPSRCWSSNACELSQRELKKIKFKKLGNGETTSAIDFDSDQKITLTISKDNPRKYIFSNSGKAIVLQNGSRTLTLKANGETEFTEENGRLKKVLGAFGIPRECTSQSSCSLIPEDLEEIMFKVFEGVAGEVTVTPTVEGQSITLRMEEPGPQYSKKRYIFNNNHSTPITITKGSISIALDGSSDSTFVENNGALKKIELSDYGIPKECLSGTCSLDGDDLRTIRFRALGEEEGNVTVPSNQTVTLDIVTTSSNNKKYVFRNSGQDINLQKNTRTLTLGRETKFIPENDGLKKLELGDYGLPNNCERQCTLRPDDLEEVRFEGLESSEAQTVTNFPESQTITLEIKDETQKRYIFKNSGEAVNIQRGTSTITLKANGDTRFVVNENKLRTLETNEYGLPAICTTSNQCTLTEDDLKEIKFKDLVDLQGEVTVENFPTQKIQLKMVLDGSNTNRYIFINNSDQAVSIKKGGQTVTLNPGKTRFSTESGCKLKALELGSFGLPSYCTTSGCDLVEDDMELIKFKSLDGGTGDITISSYPSDKGKVKLKIDSTDPNKKKYIITSEYSSPIEIQKGSDPAKKVTLKSNGKTKFTEDGENLKEFNLDNYGIPSDCNTSSPCNLTQDDLEDISFQALGDGTQKVTVTNYPENQTISLNIIGSGNDRRYIFTNGSSNVITIQRDSSSLTLKASGKTKFTLDGQKLKELKLNNYGIPVDCETAKTCTLEEDDLKDINFKDISTGTEEITVTNFPNQKIQLKIETSGSTKKYIFTNNSSNSITISKGSSTVTLKPGKTRFTVEGDNKLKTLELGTFGLPSECISSKFCTLTQDDLEQVKFDGFEGDGDATVANLPSGQTISLKIDEGEDTKKYIFTNNSSNSITISKGSSPSITLAAGAKTKFTENTDKLKKLELGEYGLPKNCSTNCELTADDLEDVKFEALGDDGMVNVTSPSSSTGKISTLRIETDDSGTKKYIFTNSSGQPIVLKRGEDASKTVTIKIKGGTKFSGENNKLTALQLGDLGLPKRCLSSNSCTLSEDDLKDIKFEKLGEESAEEIVAVSNYPSESNQKISLTIENIPESNNDKKYIFSNNSSKSVEIQRGTGGTKKVTLGTGKTRFTVEDDKLKEVELGNYGLPDRCVSGSECKLTQDDLEQIKFEKLGEESGGQVSVTGLSSGQTVTLKIITDASNKSRYIFSNEYEQEIKIKRGDDDNKSITIKAKSKGKTRFIGDDSNSKLKELEVGSFGLPNDCITNKTCSLVGDDLEMVKFEGFNGEGDATVTNLASGQKITLKIDDSGSTKKYIFSNNSNQSIQINRDSTSIELRANGKTRFTENSSNLKKLELGNYGLPKSCDSGNSCELTEDDLEQVKFDGFGDDRDSTIANYPSGKKITLNIVSLDNNNKRYLFSFGSDVGKHVLVTRGTKSVTLKSKGKTRFTVESGKLKEITVGGYGLPKNCDNQNQCTLYPDDLEEIEFSALGEDGGEVSATGLSSNQSIILKLIGEGTNRKYVFDNSTSSDVVIKRGDSEDKKVTLTKGKKTKFSVDNEKLKSLVLGRYGLPKRCENSSTCTLYADDLEDIKFSVLDDGTEKVTVGGLADDQTISLVTETMPGTNNQKKYIFTNSSSSEITIKRGTDETKKVTLKVGKTRFTVDGDKLKLQELGNYGLPKSCDTGTECQLTQDDLEQIKFSTLNGEGSSVTGFPSGVNITLKKISESSGSGSRYIFENNYGQEIKVNKDASTSVTLKTGKTRFTAENDKLKEMTLGEHGIPSNCSTGTDCTLIEDDLEQIKFSALGEENEGSVTVSNFPSTSGQIKLKIDSSDSTNKKYTFINDSGSEITIKRGNDSTKSLTLKSNGKTKFKVEGGKLAEIQLDSNGLPKECEEKKTCTLNNEDLENVKFLELGGDNEGSVSVTGLTAGQTITVKIDGSINKKYIFINNTGSEITIKRGSDDSKKVTLESNKKTRFTVDDSTLKLKKMELWDYGLPSSCKNQTSCSLSEDDLKDIKFKDLGDETVNDDEVKVTGLTGDTINLKIETESDGSTKKYKFDNSSRSSAITIQRGNEESKKVTLDASKETTFTVEDNKLKKEETQS